MIAERASHTDGSSTRDHHSYLRAIIGSIFSFGAELSFVTVLFNDGTITLQGVSLEDEDAPVTNSITGGTGAYAGARGVETEREASGGSRNEFRITVSLTFIP